MLSVNSLTCAILGSTWLEWDWEPCSSISWSNGTLSSRRTLTRCSKRPKPPTSAATLMTTTIDCGSLPMDVAFLYVKSTVLSFCFSYSIFLIEVTHAFRE